MKKLAALLVLVAVGCGSAPPAPPPQKENAKEKPADKPRDDPPPVKPQPQQPVKTADPPPSRPMDSDALGRATQKGWERGRVALVVDLVIRSKSFDPGFEAALIFIPEMKEGVTAALTEQASSRDARVSERCLQALGEMAARPGLIPDAQRSAATAVVTQRLRTETGPGPWSAAVYALGALSGHDSGPDVVAALGRALDELSQERDCSSVVRACAEVLANVRYREATTTLIQALNRVRDRHAVHTLVRALGRLGGKEATKRITVELGSPDAGDREAAAAALGEAGGPEAASALRNAIEKPADTETLAVRRAAVAALESMGGDDAIKALRTCLEDLAPRTEESWVVIKRDLSETLERIQRK